MCRICSKTCIYRLILIRSLKVNILNMAVVCFITSALKLLLILVRTYKQNKTLDRAKEVGHR